MLITQHLSLKFHSIISFNLDSTNSSSSPHSNRKSNGMLQVRCSRRIGVLANKSKCNGIRRVNKRLKAFSCQFKLKFRDLQAKLSKIHKADSTKEFQPIYISNSDLHLSNFNQHNQYRLSPKISNRLLKYL